MSNSLFIINFGSSVRQEFRLKGKKSEAPEVNKSIKLENQLIDSAIQMELNRTKRKKDSHLEKYIRIIERRYKESEMNAAYAFPRHNAGERELSPTNSIESMNGTLVYKLSRQNRKLRFKVDEPPKKRLSSRILIREKIQWPPRKRLATDTNRSRDITESRSISNPHQNVIPHSARLSNPPPPRKPQTGRDIRSRGHRLVQSVVLNMQCSSVLRT
jgi:hypothetical protein